MSIGSLRFLVAEDSETQRSLLVRTLASLGAKTVHESLGGHGALKVVEDPTRPIDIIIAGLNTPGMDGGDLIRHLGRSRVRASVVPASVPGRRLIEHGMVAPRAFTKPLESFAALKTPLSANKRFTRPNSSGN